MKGEHVQLDNELVNSTSIPLVTNTRIVSKNPIGLKVIPLIQGNDEKLKAAARNYDLLMKELDQDSNFLSHFDSEGFSLLHWATHGDKSDIRCIILLLEKGLDSSFRCKFNRTALHYACRYGHLEAVKALLEDNPEMLEVKDRNSNTPIELAIREKYQQVVDYLQQYKESLKQVKVETKLDTDYESKLSEGLSQIHVSQTPQVTYSKSITTNEMRELVLRYILIAQEPSKAIDELDSIYKKLTDKNNVTLFYLGYLEKNTT